MGSDLLVEILKAIGRGFLNPVFYYAIILAVLAGYDRSKRERQHFYIKKYGPLQELRFLFSSGLLAGIVISVLSVISGFTLSTAVIPLYVLCTMILSIIGNLRLLSPALTFGGPILVILAAKYFGWSIPYIQVYIDGFSTTMFAGLLAFIGLLLVAEGVILSTNGTKFASPKLRKSRRGLSVGSFEQKRIWFIPVVCFLPLGPLTSHFSWWPSVDWGAHSYSLLVFPVAIGSQLQVVSSLPEYVIKKVGIHTIWLGMLATIVAIVGFWTSYAIYAALAVTIVGKLWILHMHRMRERSKPFYFVPQSKGFMILDIIPGSPAEKMDLKIGECIYKCNGKVVSKKSELYEALQKNRAFCKLEVLDRNGEVRFVQHALYEGDHHELGILTIDEKKQWDEQQVS